MAVRCRERTVLEVCIVSISPPWNWIQPLKLFHRPCGDGSLGTARARNFGRDMSPCPAVVSAATRQNGETVANAAHKSADSVHIHVHTHVHAHTCKT